MVLLELRYYLTVVHEENMSVAAEALHLTRPTLSRQIAALETELGPEHRWCGDTPGSAPLRLPSAVPGADHELGVRLEEGRTRRRFPTACYVSCSPGMVSSKPWALDAGHVRPRMGCGREPSRNHPTRDPAVISAPFRATA